LGSSPPTFIEDNPAYPKGDRPEVGVRARYTEGMKVLVQVPDDIGEKLEAQWADLPRHALEALAVDAYRSGILSTWEVQRMLGISSRWETESFLQRAGAPLQYSADDLQQDLATLRQLSHA
jgi:predicted HTH domain antitoxin